MRAKGIKTVTRADLSDRVSRKVKLSKADSNHLVDSMITLMSERLSAGEDVKLSGFGNFVIQEQKARIGRNPKTGIEVKIAPRRAVSFKPSPKIQSRVDSALKAPKGVSDLKPENKRKTDGVTKRWTPNPRLRAHVRF